MGAEFRWLALVAGVGSAVFGLGLSWVVATLLFKVQRDRAANGDPLVTPWVLGFAILLTAAIVISVTWYAMLRLAERRAGRTAQAMRQLIQRAEEYGAGGFAFEPLTDELVPLTSDMEEIDSLSRVLDRNHHALMRALTAERSFAADASHQLRTPLAALLLRLEEISESDDLETARHEADIAIGQTERLAGVVDDLLHRTRAGHADGGRSVSVDTVLTQLLKEWEPSFAGTGRALHSTIERGMIVRSSASAISQILNTLVENSLAHGDGDVDIRAHRSGPSAVIEVTDQGPGIPPRLARVIFERGTTTGTGTGLGLAVARETAESFGGRLELTQAEPAVFTLYVSMSPVR
ncbi:sensor histidine kinase [Ornithinimicrobium cavernae]|uniref:sensor histidine kinase n=1 Tax=Ornithinimicrobium cavernae TaxID=2666047 RepID=UPI000D69FE8B|nr:HAMP domain-containing sensor histidine kinase [Ornithinimicrobium cavernae]